jgi:hypothetical protein
MRLFKKEEQGDISEREDSAQGAWRLVTKGVGKTKNSAGQGTLR